MKSIYLALLALLLSALTGCQKEPSTDDLYQDYMVYTAHDTATDFHSFTTYFLPDSILLIGNRNETEYWKDEDAQSLIAEVHKRLQMAGYTPAPKPVANLGLQLSYVKRVTYYVGYDDPFWWWYYPYFWTPDYWGDWLGWYYPYTVSYGYTQGSMLIEMLNLQRAIEPNEKLKVVWNAYLGGLLTTSKQANEERLKDAIRQAFMQSPYLERQQPR